MCSIYSSRKRLASAVFLTDACFVSLPTAWAAMQSKSSPSCQCIVDPTLSCWSNKAPLEGIAPRLGFTTDHQSHHTITFRAHMHTHNKNTKTHRFARVLLLNCWCNCFTLDNFMSVKWKARVCLSVYSVELQCLEWPVDKLYPMSYANLHKAIQADSE